MLPSAPRGVLQVGFTFDIDANDILNLFASDKTTGQSNLITITDDKGDLSKEGLERIVNEAEKHRAGREEAAAERISAKDGFESYAYDLRNTLIDAQTSRKFDADDKSRLEAAVNESTS